MDWLEIAARYPVIFLLPIFLNIIWIRKLRAKNYKGSSYDGSIYVLRAAIFCIGGIVLFSSLLAMSVHEGDKFFSAIRYTLSVPFFFWGVVVIFLAVSSSEKLVIKIMNSIACGPRDITLF
jgi:hypothetical protein